MIVTANACLQTLFLIGFMGGLFAAEYTGEPDLEWVPVVSFVGFALTQLLGALILYFGYQEKRFKQYLECVLYFQIIGTAIGCIFVAVEPMAFIGGIILLVAWLIAPFFQAFVCLGHSWAAFLDVETIEEYV